MDSTKTLCEGTESMVLPNLHDAKFTGIALYEEFIDLDFVTIDKNAIRLRLKGTTRLRANEFREGNIVLDACIVEPTAITQEIVADLLGSNEEAGVTNVLASARREKLSAVVINPSYGCSLVALCANVLLVDCDRKT